MQGKTRRLTESAMLIAVALVLELVSKMFIPDMPFSGQITIASMLPILLISYRYGVKWGTVASLTYAFLEMAIGGKTVAAAFMPGYFGEGTMIGKAVIMCLLDYIFAFMALALGGVFRNRIANKGVSLMCGSILALVGRYCSHILSGYILFSGWAEWFFTQEGFPAWGAVLTEKLGENALGWAYSVVYNGIYMIPEILITAVAALLIAKVPKIVEKVQ